MEQKEIKTKTGRVLFCALFVLATVFTGCSKHEDLSKAANEELVTKSFPTGTERDVYISIENQSKQEDLTLQFSSHLEHIWGHYKYFCKSDKVWKDFSGGSIGDPTTYNYISKETTYSPTFNANYKFEGSSANDWMQEILIGVKEDDQIRLKIGSTSEANCGDSYSEILWKKEGTPVKVEVKNIGEGRPDGRGSWSVYYKMVVTDADPVKKPEMIDYTAKKIEIKTSGDLRWVAEVTNVGDHDFDGYNYNGFKGWTLEQTQNIDLFGCEWIPIGNLNKAEFKGIFNGNKHKIENINVSSSLGTGILGLFGATLHATIKNVILNSGSICNEDRITGSIGGIVGYASQSQIIACESNAFVTDHKKSHTNRVGGVVGSLSGSILLACENNRGKVSGWDVGGVAGRCFHGSSIIGCTNRADIEGQNCGGIAFELAQGSIAVSCVSHGFIACATEESVYGSVFAIMSDYDVNRTKYLYSTIQNDQKVAGRDDGNKGWNLKGCEHLENKVIKNLDEINSAIAEWSANTPACTSRYKFVVPSDDFFIKCVEY